MLRSALFFLFLLAGAFMRAQEVFLEYQVLPRGGKDEFEQVLETQLNLPQVLLTRHFETNVKVNFDIDSAGHATNLAFDGTINNALRKELSRVMRFYTFQGTSVPLTRAQPYYVEFPLSTSKYNRYLKQRFRYKMRCESPCDSSFAVHTRATQSPRYYNNDETGLAEYILSEISYPEAAREKSVQGTVVLDFTVETNGFVTGIQPRNQVAGGCTEEAVRLIRQTRWNPAVRDGKAVRYKMSYPITFSLLNSDRSELQPATTVGN